MSEQAVVAESSAAVEAPVMDVSRGPLVDITPEQRAEFRKTGNLPTPPKTEEAASSSEPKPEKGEAKPAGDSETPENKQEPTEQPKVKPQTAKERITQLEATIDKIRKDAGLKETTKAESSPAKPEPVREHPPTRPKPTAEDKKEDGTPKFETYEDFVEDLTEWKSEQREVKNQREQREQAQANAFKSKVEAARSRYENFDDVKDNFLASVSDPGVNSVVRDMLNDSDVLPDLVFTIGSSKDDLASFVKMAKENPGKALRYIALTESLIAEELEGKAKPKVEPEPPAKPITAAPKPPSEVGGRAASPGDELASAAKAGDFRAFKAEANRRQLAKLKTG